MQTAQIQQTATGNEIRQILGPVDDELVMTIIYTGATVSEVAEAYRWLNNSDYLGVALERSLNERTRQVYNILINDRDQISREER